MGFSSRFGGGMRFANQANCSLGRPFQSREVTPSNAKEHLVTSDLAAICGLGPVGKMATKPHGEETRQPPLLPVAGEGGHPERFVPSRFLEVEDRVTTSKFPEHKDPTSSGTLLPTPHPALCPSEGERGQLVAPLTPGGSIEILRAGRIRPPLPPSDRSTRP